MAAEEDLKVQLEEACEGLWWSSESDYPIEVVWVSAADHKVTDHEGASTLLAAVVCGASGVGDTDALTIGEVEDFFARSLTPKSWHTAEDKAQITQLQQLKTLLVQSLKPLKVYRYGSVEIDAYILGLTADGTVAGIKTRLVET